MTMTHSATYSPEDDKLRLTPAYRLDKETEYARVKAEGFNWAPMQKVFYAVWSPSREDLLIELAGEIEDEDKSLVERAEERAERFEDYSDNRRKDSEHAHASVKAISDGIPFGQPILVGHHSERHARRDAERIENGMRKAVKMWQTSQYWTHRAAGAIASAKYKERADVRARRIKTIEADLRRVLKSQKQADVTLQLWTKDGLTLEQARFIAGGHLTVVNVNGQHWSAYDVLQPDETRYKACPPKTVADCQAAARAMHARVTATCERWIEHYSHRLEYEHAMLEAQGGAVLLEKSGKCPAAKLPLCNYKAPDGLMIPNRWQNNALELYPQVEMTQKEYAAMYRDYKGTHVVGNSHRVRTCVLHSKRVCVFLTDAKVHAIPAALDAIPTTVDAVVLEQRKVVRAARQAYREELGPRTTTTDDPAAIKAMSATLKAGVKVVSVPNLFPTPPNVAEQMVDLLNLEPGQAVLEPSAGTGRLIEAVRHVSQSSPVYAVELNAGLADMLRNQYDIPVLTGDFLDVPLNIRPSGKFDRIIMNPPFDHGSDIKHIQHAMTLLEAGGRLVALCAAGPRQQATLQPLASEWVDLGADVFDGTGVRVAMLAYNKPEQEQQ